MNKNVKSGESYTYTVRCLDKNGDFISAYDKDGKSFIFLTPPVISSLDVTENGVVIKWNADKNAENFRIYRKTGGSDWSKLADTDSRTYTDRTAASGKEYSYTVRCITADGSEWTSYYNSGKSVMFVKTPQVKSFENVLHILSTRPSKTARPEPTPSAALTKLATSSARSTGQAGQTAISRRLLS